MARSIFLTALLASAILAYVQSNPVPGNSSKTLIVPAVLYEPEISAFEDNVNNTWINLKKVMKKQYIAMLQDPIVSNSFLSTLNTAIEKLKLMVEETFEGNVELNDPELDKTGQVGSWEKFLKEMREKYEEMKNSKVQMILDTIDNARRETKLSVQLAICILRKRMENLEKNNDETIVIEYCDDVSTSNDKAQQGLRESKKQLEDKYVELMKNPKAHDTFEKTFNMIEKIKPVIKNIIESVRTEVKGIRRNSEEKKDDSSQLRPIEKMKKGFDDIKNKLEDTLSKSKVNGVIEKVGKKIDEAKDSFKKIVESLKNRTSNASKPLNSEEEEENSTTLNLKDEATKKLNELKKEVDKILKELKRKWSNHSELQNSEEEEENSTTLDLKDEAKETNEVKKKFDKVLKKVQENLEKAEKKLKELFDKSKIKEIIDNIKKSKSSTPKPLNSEEEEENSTTLNLKDEAKKQLNELKKKFDEVLKELKRKWSNHSELQNSEEEEENSTTLDLKDEAKETNEVKKKFDEVLKELKEKWSSHSEPLNSEEEEENSTTLNLKDEAKKQLNELKKKFDEVLKKLKEKWSSLSELQNSEKEEENSTTLDLKDEAKKQLNELKKTLEKLLKELLNDPKLKKAIDAIRKKICKPPKQPGNPENEEELKDGEKKDSESDVMEKSGKEAWNDFKKKVEELLKKILPESKRKEIIESVKNATCSTPKPGNPETGEKNSDALGLKEKVQEAWNDFKKKNPKVNEVIEEWKKVVKQGKNTVEEVIKSVINKNNKPQELS